MNTMAQEKELLEGVPSIDQIRFEKTYCSLILPVNKVTNPQRIAKNPAHQDPCTECFLSEVPRSFHVSRSTFRVAPISPAHALIFPQS
jgi:hypothetical protein